MDINKLVSNDLETKNINFVIPEEIISWVNSNKDKVLGELYDLDLLPECINNNVQLYALACFICGYELCKVKNN